ncbi:MAG: Adenylate cyclase [Acidobacteriaceae bacterium]|nr:Adenylate cyclase [Acidobacteriaceae bacterium]
MNSADRSMRFARFGLFEVDLLASELRKQGRKIKLQEQPCRVLAILLERHGEVVTRDDLRKKLWTENTFVDFDHSLNTAIMRLREALGESSENPLFIETLPRVGYRFIAPVEEVSEPEFNGHSSKVIAAPVAPHENGSSELAPVLSGIRQVVLPVPPQSFDFRRWLLIFGILGLIALVALGISLFRSRKSSLSASETPPFKSIVVLPLENLSRDMDQEYFADGMTDELIAHLAQIRSLRVISRTSAMEYKRTRKPLSEIARDLNVDAIVEGTVLRSGNRVRITAELIQVSTDRHLWAQTYESELGDILRLQSEVAGAIVNEIRIKLTPEEKRLLASTKPVSTESYENYLRGKYYWNKRSEEGLRKAIGYFQLAVQEDDHSALAFAGLADCYSIIGSAIVGTVPSHEVAAKAKAAALKALELDSKLAEAQISLATVNFNYDWDWAAAGNGFKKAIELNPSYATAYQRYSLYLIAMGHGRESLAEMDRARELDPVSISMNFSYGWRLYMARQYDQAIEQLRNTLEMDPNFVLPRMVLGQSYEQKGQYDQAISELQKAATISHQSPPVLGALGHVYASAGRKADAERVLHQLTEESKKQYVSPFYFGIVYAGLRQDGNAMDLLEKAYQDGSNSIVFLKVDPELDTLRPNPRFQTLLQRLALPK